MENFQNIFEGRSMGSDNIDKALNTLSASLKPTSNLAKGIIKEYGQGYKSDFDKMESLVDDLMMAWEELKHETSK